MKVEKQILLEVRKDLIAAMKIVIVVMLIIVATIN